MKVWYWWAFALICISLLVSGCDQDETGSEPAHAGAAMPVFKEFHGWQGPFLDRGFFIVQRPDVWQNLWNGWPVPDVDFSTQTVLVAMLGQQPTTGYDIHITDVRATDKDVVAYVTQTCPDPGADVEKLITYPYHMVVVPKITQTVSFVVAGMTLPPIVVITDGFQGQQSNAAAAQTAVIRDQLAWDTFWSNNFGPTVAAPAVDFTRNMAVAVFIGQKPTGGYDVTIPSIAQIDDRLVVNYRLFAPEPGAVVTQVVTSPYAIAVIPANTLPIAFNCLPPQPIVRRIQ